MVFHGNTDKLKDILSWVKKGEKCLVSTGPKLIRFIVSAKNQRFPSN